MATTATLIRYQPVDGLDVAGASAWRIMYLSEDLGGRADRGHGHGARAATPDAPAAGARS